MVQILQFIATFCAAIFAGAAIYINIAEHPARMAGDIRSALRQWAISYKRATLMQAPLAAVGFLASVAVWMLGASIWWLIAGLLIGAVVPLTLTVIMPTNRRLLAAEGESAETRSLLEHWGRLHTLRSLLSLLATALLLWQLCAN
jgi:hypothetical protein